MTKRIDPGSAPRTTRTDASSPPAKPAAPNEAAAPAKAERPLGVPKDHDASLAAAAVTGQKRGKDTAQFSGTSVAKSQAVQEAKDKSGQYLMCPVLGSLIAEGSLHKDDQGNISLKELYDVMVHRLGISPERAAVTVGTGFIGNHATDALKVAGGKFNLAHLAGSLLDHRAQGDTGILRGGKFNEDEFDALVSHSKDGKTLTVEDFSEAILAQLKRDNPKLALPKGTSEDIFEMAALINTFGTVDKNGERRIDISTLRDIYQNRKLPSKDVLMSRSATGVRDHVKTMAEMTDDLAKNAAKGKAMPKGVCPYLNRAGGGDDKVN